ncbi:hypothetical protein [Ketobacter sp.]
MKRPALATKALPYAALLPPLLLSPLLLVSNLGAAQTPRGNIGFDAMYFAEQPLLPDQSGQSVQPGLSGDLDWSTDLSDDIRVDLGTRLHITPDAENEVTGDVKEAVFLTRVKAFDIKLGVLQENWRVLEAWSPVDLVNQRDMVEDFRGKVKLGQPGVSVNTFYNDVVFTALALPYTRERRIADGSDRLRTLPAPLLDSTFENGQSDIGFALRLQYRIGDFDLGLSRYQGHTREPLYQPVFQNSTLSGFNERYEDIAQTGLELQYVVGDTVLKAEVIYQSGATDSFVGSGIGSETTFNQISNGFDSITVYAEGYYDTRNDAAPLTPFQRDVFVGLRYNTNDVNDSLLDLRYTHDFEFDSDLIELRASRRLGSSHTLSAQILLPLSVSEDPALRGFKQDKYFQLSWVWYW